MTIVKLNDKDERLLTEFENLLKDIKRIESLDFSLNSYYLLIDNEGKVKGYISLYQVLDEVNILYIYVDKELRGKGYGKALFNEALKGITIKNYKVFLEVRVSNTIALNLYTKLGFKEYAIRKAYYSDGEDAILMEMEVC